MDYYPDVWIVVEISGAKVPKTYHRVLSGWYGGYASGDSWKLNSGITKIVETETTFDVYGTTGSVYHCLKSVERFSNYTGIVYESYISDNCDDVSMKQVPMSEVIHLYLDK